MTYNIKQICERFGVGEHTVLAWIRSGELAAVNVGRSLGGKPKWRITPEAIQAFELFRTPTPDLPRPRRKTATDNVIAFY